MLNTSDQRSHKFMRASTPELLKEVFSLRYRAYRNTEAILPCPTEQFSDKYDKDGLSRSYLYMKNGVYVGSIRATLYSPKNNWELSPAFETFSEEIEQKIGKDKIILESNRFVVDPSHQAESNRQVLKLVRAIILNTRIFNPDYVITVVHPDHAGFYDKIFGFKPLSSVKLVKGLKERDGILIAVRGETFAQICEGIKAMRLSQEQIDVYQETGVLYDSL